MTAPGRPEPASLDRSALERLRRIGGDSLLRQMIALFRENVARCLEAARAALHDGDLQALARAAHSLKSSAGNLGAVRLHGLAEDTEQHARRGDLADPAARLAELERAGAAAIAALNEEANQLEP